MIYLSSVITARGIRIDYPVTTPYEKWMLLGEDDSLCDWTCYAARYTDINGYSSTDAETHWYASGYSEGRICTCDDSSSCFYTLRLNAYYSKPIDRQASMLALIDYGVDSDIYYTENVFTDNYQWSTTN